MRRTLARRRGLEGDEVEQLVDFASIGWKSPLDRLLRTRMATRPIQFTGMEERHTPKSELLQSPQIHHLKKCKTSLEPAVKAGYDDL